MAGLAEERWSVDKLDGSNWLTWKFQMKHLLLAKDLWGFIDGTEVLAGDASAQQTTDYNKKSRRAFSTIVMAVSATQLYLITSCDTPKKAWDSLRTHFERDSLSNKIMMKKLYFRTEMAEGTSVEEHLKGMKEITDRLAAIGSPISEEDQVVTLLGSLPDSYATLVTALEARGDTLQLKDVQEALVHEEQKKRSPGCKQESALFSGTKKKKFKGPVKCYNCGKVGHIHRNCFKLKDKSSF